MKKENLIKKLEQINKDVDRKDLENIILTLKVEEFNAKEDFFRKNDGFLPAYAINMDRLINEKLEINDHVSEKIKAAYLDGEPIKINDFDPKLSFDTGRLMSCLNYVGCDPDNALFYRTNKDQCLWIENPNNNRFAILIAYITRA